MIRALTNQFEFEKRRAWPAMCKRGEEMKVCRGVLAPGIKSNMVWRSIRQ